MGFPIRKLVVRTTLVGAMLAGGLLSAGISQAQDVGAQDERSAELVAASGGPAPSQHLIPFAGEAAAVEVREAEVAGSAAESASSSDASPPPSSSQPASPSRTVAAAGVAPTR